MTATADTNAKVSSYLEQVRAALRGLPQPQIEEILWELRSHVTELGGAEGQGIEAALRSLGNPIDLANTYQSEFLIKRSECSGSPLVILQALRATTRGGPGRVAATVLYAFGYINALALWAAAVDKVFTPSRAGLWFNPGKVWPFTLVTTGDTQPGAREVLGWWFVPFALLVGWAIKYLTDRIARWWIARYGGSRKIAGGLT